MKKGSVAATSPWDELRDSFNALSAKVTAVEAGQAALDTRVEGLTGSVAELKVSGQNAAAEIAELSVRVTALEKPVPPPPPPPPGDILTADDLEYLGTFLPPKPTAEDAASVDSRYRKFDYTAGIASRGPNGGMLLSGNALACWMAEITIPEPSLTDPVRAEFLQPFANAVRPGIDKPRLAGVLWHEGDPERIAVSLERHYNVIGTFTAPSLCFGPTDLSKHVSEGTDLLEVTYPDGSPVAFERVANSLFVSPWGLAFANQKAKHEKRSDGPALATFDVVEGKPTNFRQRLFYPRESYIFPDPLYYGDDPPTGGWVEASTCPHAATIDGAVVLVAHIGLGTGLENFQGRHVEPDGSLWIVRRNSYYGGPGNYPVDVNFCKGPAAKGYHAPPYQDRLYVYSAQSIEDASDPAGVLPDVMIDLSPITGANNGCGYGFGSIVWLPEKRWILLPQGGSSPKVHVVGVK